MYENMKLTKNLEPVRRLRNLSGRFAKSNANVMKSNWRTTSNLASSCRSLDRPSIAISYLANIHCAKRDYALRIIKDNHADIGPTLAAEILAVHHGFKVSRETVRKWMQEDGICLSRKQRRTFHQPRLRRVMSSTRFLERSVEDLEVKDGKKQQPAPTIQQASKAAA